MVGDQILKIVLASLHQQQEFFIEGVCVRQDDELRSAWEGVLLSDSILLALCSIRVRQQIERKELLARNRIE